MWVFHWPASFVPYWLGLPQHGPPWALGSACQWCTWLPSAQTWEPARAQRCTSWESLSAPAGTFCKKHSYLLTMLKHIEAETKWAPFCRHFQMRFLVTNVMCFDLRFTEMCSQDFNWQLEQLESLHYENTSPCPMITHTIDSYWNQNNTKSVTNLKNLVKLGQRSPYT